MKNHEIIKLEFNSLDNIIIIVLKFRIKKDQKNIAVEKTNSNKQKFHKSEKRIERLGAALVMN